MWDQQKDELIKVSVNKYTDFGKASERTTPIHQLKA